MEAFRNHDTRDYGGGVEGGFAIVWMSLASVSIVCAKLQSFVAPAIIGVKRGVTNPGGMEQSRCLPELGRPGPESGVTT